MGSYKSVAVLLSSYNGANHIEEQIKSILNQEQVTVKLVIRDDGSTDNTITIASKYTSDIIKGRNIGYRYSFLELIKNAPEADYYALSDQDDIWRPKKLVSATKMIEEQESYFGESRPVLYACGRDNYMNGEITKANEVRDYQNFPFNAFNNGWHLQGCTMVFNNSLKKELASYIPKELITSHDVWIHQVCKAINGKIIYDKRPFLLYRIEDNEIGVPAHRKWSRVVELFKKKERSDVVNLCGNLLNGFSGKMPIENRVICEMFYNYQKNKKKLLFTRRIYQGDMAHRIYLFFLILLDAA